MNEGKAIEYIVQKKAGVREYVIKAAIIVAALFISLATIWFLGIFGLVFTFFAIFFAIYFYRYTVIEYEYIIIGNEMTVDVIYGRSKRKELQKFDLNRLELIADVDSDKAAYYAKATEMTCFDFISGYDDIPGVTPLMLVTGYGASNAKLFIEADSRIRDYFRSMYPSKCYF